MMFTRESPQAGATARRTSADLRSLSSSRIEALSLAEIENILHSDEHYGATVTRNYGTLDPLEEPARLIFPCHCGSRAQLHFDTPTAEQMRGSRPLPAGETQAYSVRCGQCGRAGSPSLRQWRAVVDWNYLNAQAFALPLPAFPFFNLAGLSAAQAQDKLESIRVDLALRRAQAKKQREQGAKVGGRYLAKIDAFLGWANVGLRVLQERRRVTAAAA
jgi:hypothetical protein